MIGLDKAVRPNGMGVVGCKGLSAKRFAVDDAKATPLAVFADGGGTAAAVRKYDDWTAIYVATTYPPIAFINNIARYARVRLFADMPGVAIATGHRFIVAYCQKINAEGKILLPKSFSVYSVFEKKHLGERSEIDLSCRQGDTRLYFLGTKEETARFASQWESTLDN